MSDTEAYHAYLRERLDAIRGSSAPHEIAEARRIVRLLNPSPPLLHVHIKRYRGRPQLGSVSVPDFAKDGLLPVLSWTIESDAEHREVVVLRLHGEYVTIEDVASG
jgi:hypothetical protein